MEGVQLRLKRGVKDEKVRRSYSCSDLSQLLGLPGGGEEDSDSETGEPGEPMADQPREKLRSEASESEVMSRRVSALVKIRRWQSGRRKKIEGPPVISAPIQPTDSPLPQPNRLTTIIPQNINFNNPFGTIGRRNRRKQREGMPIVVLEKFFGPPPRSSATLPPLGEHTVYPLTNPFGTLPRRNAAKRMGVANDGGEGTNGDQSFVLANFDSFLPPSISVSPSPSPSRSPSHSPSLSPSHSLSDALTVVEKRASTNLTAPSYHSLLGRSMERVCLSSPHPYIQFPKCDSGCCSFSQIAPV